MTSLAAFLSIGATPSAGEDNLRLTSPCFTIAIASINPSEATIMSKQINWYYFRNG